MYIYGDPQKRAMGLPSMPLLGRASVFCDLRAFGPSRPTSTSQKKRSPSRWGAGASSGGRWAFFRVKASKCRLQALQVSHVQMQEIRPENSHLRMNSRSREKNVKMLLFSHHRVKPVLKSQEELAWVTTYVTHWCRIGLADLVSRIESKPSILNPSM